MFEKEFKNPLVNSKAPRFYTSSTAMSEKEFSSLNRVMSIRASVIREAEMRLFEQEPNVSIEKLGALRSLIFCPGPVKILDRPEKSAFVKAYGRA